MAQQRRSKKDGFGSVKNFISVLVNVRVVSVYVVLKVKNISEFTKTFKQQIPPALCFYIIYF